MGTLAIVLIIVAVIFGNSLFCLSGLKVGSSISENRSFKLADGIYQ